MDLAPFGSKLARVHNAENLFHDLFYYHTDDICLGGQTAALPLTLTHIYKRAHTYTHSLTHARTHTDTQGRRYHFSPKRIYGPPKSPDFVFVQKRDFLIDDEEGIWHYRTVEVAPCRSYPSLPNFA